MCYFTLYIACYNDLQCLVGALALPYRVSEEAGWMHKQQGRFHHHSEMARAGRSHTVPAQPAGGPARC